MKKRIILLCIAIATATVFTGCGSGVSQEDYDKIVSELEEATTELNEIMSELDEANVKIDQLEKANQNYETNLESAKSKSDDYESQYEDLAYKYNDLVEAYNSLLDELADEPIGDVMDIEEYNSGITYEQLLRQPDNYYGSPIILSGDVLQVISETKEEVDILIAVDGNNEQLLAIGFDASTPEYRILENDNITIYGISLGLASATDVWGSKKLYPSAYADIIEINQ